MSLLNEAGIAQEATEADWDHHKETIRRLYCVENRELKGPGGVQDEMKRRHQFDAEYIASAYQYEKHFKRWKFRKNLKKEEWIPVKQKILSRKREGKDSDVYLEGVLMHAKKVKRGIGRYRMSEDQMDLFRYDHATLPQTPDGVTICTPKPMENSSNAFEDLPISHYFAALLRQEIPQGVNTTFPVFAFESCSDVSASSMTMPKVVTVSPWLLEELQVERRTRATGNWIPDLSTRMDDVFPQGLELFHKFPNHAGALSMLHFMIFYVSNGYLDYANYTTRKNITNWLQQERNGSLLRQLLSVDGPTARSMLETLYPYAVEGQKASIVKIFLDLGCDPNVNLKDCRGRKGFIGDTTALGLACENKNLELVRVLLAAGADPNQPSEPTSSLHVDLCDSINPTERQCPMVLSIWGHTHSYLRFTTSEEDRGESVLLLIKTLIQGGAGVHGASPACHVPLVEAARWGNESLIHLLLEEGADVSMSDGKGRSPLAVATQSLKFGSPAETCQSLSIIRLLSASASINTPSERLRDYDAEFDEGHGPNFILPFDFSVEKGSLEVVEYLYSVGARPSQFALTCACEGRNVNVVRFTLEAGAIEIDIPAKHSALVKAIESQQAEMIRLVLESGAAQQDSNTLSLAIETAIDEGQYDIVPELVFAGLRYPSFSGSLQFAVMSAVLSGNVEILDLLLGAGAEASSDVLIRALKSKNELMIKKVLDTWTLSSRQQMQDSGYRDDEHDYCTREICKVCLRHAHCRPASPLSAAVSFGNCEIVKRLLEQGHSLEGTEALVCAVRSKNLEMAAMLLEAGSPVNASACDCETNVTPLQAAVQTRLIPLVRLLIDNGADLDMSPICGSLDFCNQRLMNWPPLQAAVYRRDLEMATMLLRAGADINNPRAEALGCSALTLAIQSRDQQIFDLVYTQSGATLDSSALLAAVEQQNIPLVTRLLTSRSRADWGCRGKFGYRSLCVAVENKSMGLVKLLLSSGVDPNNQPLESYELTALGVAIHLKQPALEIVETLLQTGADPNGFIRPFDSYNGTRTAFIEAARIGDVALVSLLIRYGADLNAYPKGATRRSPLQAACEEGKLKVVQLLLDQGVDINAPPTWYKGGTALQLAAIRGHPGIVFMLLDRGADMNAPAARIDGRTALEGAAENGRLDTVRALLDAGVGIHGAFEGQYNRALQFAEKNGYRQIQRMLIEKAGAC